MINEISTKKNLLTSHVPKRIYEGHGYALKPSVKKLTNLDILEGILKRVNDPIFSFNGDFLNITDAVTSGYNNSRTFSVKVY